MKKNAVLVVLFFVFLGVTFASVLIGPAPITVVDFLHFIFDPSQISDEYRYLFSNIRLPRAVACAIVGASLGLCGLILQTVLRNPLAEPYTLGLSGGSSFGAVVAVFVGWSPELFWLPVFSVCGCLVALALVLWVARNQFFETKSFILAGVMVSLLFGAAVVTGLAFVRPDQLQTVLFWLMGEFGTYRDVWIWWFAPLMIVLAVWAYFQSAKLDLLALGDIRAFSLGINPKREKVKLVLVCTALTALSVSIAGLVGFAGLVAPHLARRLLRTSNHRYLVVGSCLIGSVLLTIADSIAKGWIVQTTVPAGSIAALVGAPILLALLRSPQLRGH